MPSARSVLIASLLAALTVTVPATAASPAPADCPPGVGVGLLQLPRERADDPRARSYVIDHVAPGATFTRRFQVCNGSKTAVRTTLYAAAAQVRDGQFLLNVSPADNAVSRAISIDPPVLSLGPGARGVATARFAVPRDAPAGEQYAVLWAEVGGARNDVQTRSRAGIRVYLDVGPGGEQASDFRIDSLQAGRTPQGAPLVTARVVNTGARAVDLSGQLSLRDGPGQLSAGPFPVTKGTTVGPGQSAPVSIPLPPQISGGPWTADLELRSGLIRREATATLSFPEGTSATAAPVPASAVDTPPVDPTGESALRRIVVPLTVGLLGLAMLLLLVAALVSSRRSGMRKLPLVD